MRLLLYAFRVLKQRKPRRIIRKKQETEEKYTNGNIQENRTGFQSAGPRKAVNGQKRAKDAQEKYKNIRSNKICSDNARVGVEEYGNQQGSQKDAG